MADTTFCIHLDRFRSNEGRKTRRSPTRTLSFLFWSESLPKQCQHKKREHMGHAKLLGCHQHEKEKLVSIVPSSSQMFWANFSSEGWKKKMKPYCRSFFGQVIPPNTCCIATLTIDWVSASSAKNKKEICFLRSLPEVCVHKVEENREFSPILVSKER
jgi:hypothetical protein